jgi:predicted DNA-binding protein (MmcQ/YjbR family)
MNIENLLAICKKFNSVTEDIKWENHLCLSVGEKMFIVTSPDTVPITASFKVSLESFEELSEREGFKPAPYMAKYHWIYVDDIKRLTKKEWEFYLKQAYFLIASRLPVKKQKQLNIHLEI